MRFDEAGASGDVRPSGLMRYAQDLAWRHSEAAGMGRDWYDAHDSFWLVRSSALVIEARVRHGEEIIGITEVTGWRRVWGRRDTTFASSDGQRIASVESDWVLLNSAGRPKRIPEEVARLLGPSRSYRPLKVDLSEPPEATGVARVRVRAADTDPLGHLNNAAYLDIVDEAVARSAPERADTRSYRVEYLRPVLPGSELSVRAWPTADGSIACRFDETCGGEVFRALLS